MSGPIPIKIVSENKTEVFSASAGSGLMSFWWLGQAGFSFLIGEKRILIDPYLSDSLAKKYKDREFPHKRMMPVPVSPSEIKSPDWILVTHRHTDHMDPETLIPLAEANPDMKIVLPAAWYSHALQLGLNEKQISKIEAGEEINLAEGLSVEAIPSAHEEIETDADGNHLYLGYIIRYMEKHDETVRNLTLYHSGDCVPFPSLGNLLRDKNIDIAFLPVNGRDSYRRERGVPGNFTLNEAMNLCMDSNLPWLIPHHFGMFEFNTIPEAELITVLDNNPGPPENIIPEIGVRYSVNCITDEE
jgi:L-ascorbate metabolism protein UlaG (beta-lactamase superfamily)